MANGEKAGKIIGFYVKVIVKGQYSKENLAVTAFVRADCGKAQEEKR